MDIFWHGEDYDDLDVVHRKNEHISYVRHCIKKTGYKLYIQVRKLQYIVSEINIKKLWQIISKNLLTFGFCNDILKYVAEENREYKATQNLDK